MNDDTFPKADFAAKTLANFALNELILQVLYFRDLHHTGLLQEAEEIMAAITIEKILEDVIIIASEDPSVATA